SGESGDVIQNPENLELKWKFETGGGHSSPAISGNYVYVGSDDNYVYCLDKNTGELVWKFETGEVDSSPAVSGNYVYVGSFDTDIYCLDKNTGKLIWKFETGAVGSSPAVSGNYVYVGFADSIHCFDKYNGERVWEFETGDWVTVENTSRTEFIGYDNLESETKIVSYRKIKAKDKEQFQLVLEKTPFYPEGGGQVGDIGYLEVNGKKIAVLDTKKENNLIVHFTKELPENVTASVKAVVSNDRKLTAANHSATHLLHQALRTILGTHVEQKGSLVNNAHLRFDFSHFQKVSEEELQQIEDFVNEKIQSSISLNEHREIPIKEAEKVGAMMLFGEKYGNKVRMIQFGDSKELCGGIHVNNTQDIELFKITSEGSVAAGIRRIEAVTSKGAANYLKEKIDIITKHPLKGLVSNTIIQKLHTFQNNLLQQYVEVSDMPVLNIISPSNGSLQIDVLSNAIADFTKIKLDAAIIDELSNIKKAMLKEDEQKGKEQAKAIKEELLNEVKNINGVNVITKKLTAVDAATIKDLAFQLKAQIDNLYLVIGAEINGKPNLTIAISDSLATERKLHAGNIIREAAKEMQGGGGGQPFFATAGGINLNGLDAAMEKALSFVK
ncbi:MAG: hypothetical protein CVT95_08185, partial [Bacteroidetes bacterium HGW-Bacteroidetes-12]